MLFTSNRIAEYLVPWVLVTLAYPLVVVALRRLVVIASRVFASLDTGGAPYAGDHRRPYSSADVVVTVLLAATVWALAGQIAAYLAPRTGWWWSVQLHSGWEISYGFATVLAAFALPLLYIVLAPLALTLLMMLLSWLAEPIYDGLAPVDHAPAAFPNRLNTMRRALATWWVTRRRVAPDAGRN
jgi:hypothetical protein